MAAHKIADVVSNKFITLPLGENCVSRLKYLSFESRQLMAQIVMMLI
jgi:hypothetical protein